jgi:hypothetical protein
VIETSELFAKADFRTSTEAGNEAYLKNRFQGASFGGEQPGFIFHHVHAMLSIYLK